MNIHYSAGNYFLLFTGSGKRAAVFILFLILNIPVYCQQHFTKTDYDLQGIVPDNQVMQIARDRMGFYWMITNSGWLLRWNGKQFVVVNAAQKKLEEAGSAWKYFEKTNGDPVFHQIETGLFFDITSNGKLTLLDTSGQKNYHRGIYAGDRFNMNKNREQIFQLNERGIAEKFWRLYKEYKFKYQYYIDDEKYYYIMLDSVIYYYDNGRLSEIPFPDKELPQVAWRVGKYLLVKYNDTYKIYQGSKLVNEGNDPDLQLTNFMFGSIQTGKNFLLANYKNLIYKFTIADNRLKRELFFTLPLNKVYYNYYYDEKANRLFVINFDGGFSIFQASLFSNTHTDFSGTGYVIYTLCKDGKELLTNVDFARKIIAKEPDYNHTATITPLPGGNFFYPGMSGFLEVDRKMKVRRRWDAAVMSEPARSIIPFGGHLFIAASKLWKLDIQSRRLDSVPLYPPLSGVNEIKHITKGPGDYLYAAADSLFYRIDANTGIRKRVSDYSFRPGTIRSLQYDPVYNILYFTESDKGPYYIDLRNGTVIAFPVMNFKSLLSCHYLLKDKDGDFWMPTNSGLYLMRRKQFEDFFYGRNRYINYYRFGRESGIGNEEFNGGFNGNGILAEDSIYLASMGGVVSFDPRKVKERLESGDAGGLSITQILVDDSLQAGVQRLVLPPDFKRCEFGIDFPFINMPSASLEYQLKGSADTAWKLLNTDNEVLINGLLAGSYTLTVRIANHPEIAPLVFPVRVKEYWYKTKVAYIVYVALLTGLVFLFFNWRVHRIRNRSLKEIDKNRRELFTIISHDLRSPLKAYQGLADVISGLVKNKKYEQVEKVAAQIDRTGIKLDLLLNNLLKWNLLQQKKLSIRNEELDLSELVKEHASVYEEIAVLNGIGIRLSVEEHTAVLGDRDMVSLMIRNLLDNAIKNSPQPGEINITVHNNADGVFLQIMNRLKPGDKEKLEKAAMLLEAGKAGDSTSRDMGIGLKMVYLAAGKAGAKLKISTGSGNAEFSICFT